MKTEELKNFQAFLDAAQNLGKAKKVGKPYNDRRAYQVARRIYRTAGGPA